MATSVRPLGRAGKKKATVAMARRLLTVIFAMLRDGRKYQMAAA